MAQLHYWTTCDELLNRPHILTAGATGSGKSVFVNSMIYTLLTYKPDEKMMILIDPKRVELFGYKNCPHCIGYASENADIIAQLRAACDMMDKRYQEMQAAGLRKYNGSDIYIVIDEFADLMTTAPKETTLYVQRLAQLGRAANFHLWICTQAPNRSILKANIVLNMTDRIALHCNDSMESRQIIGEKGAETLPRYGKAIYKSAEGVRLIDVPFTPESDLAARVQFWT